MEIHPTYLPFAKEELRKHFEHANDPDGNVSYFIRSAEAACAFKGERVRGSLQDMRRPLQIEKDEKFWTAATLMTIWRVRNRNEVITELLHRAFADREPLPLVGLTSWTECLDGDLHLCLEAVLPSPKGYSDWLSERLKIGDNDPRHLIPFIRDSAVGKKNLEGATHVDALIVNASNGFSIMIEAKVLSDISYEVTYDVTRNQIARNLDVLLKNHRSLALRESLNRRDPTKTLFLLQTPRIFKEPGRNRLYYYKFREYTTDATTIGRDIPHRVSGVDWANLSRRIGWITWEDCREVESGCCAWLDS